MSETVKAGGVEIRLSQSADGRWFFRRKEDGRWKTVFRSKLEDAQKAAKNYARAMASGRALMATASGETLAQFHEWMERRDNSGQLSVVFTAFMASKRHGGLSAVYMRDLERVQKFIDSMGPRTPMGAITPDQIQGYLSGFNPRRSNNIRCSLVTFFRWAARHNYMKRGETAPEMLDRVREPQNAIETYTPTELAALLLACPDDGLSFVALGAFAGIRSEEIGRMTWEMVNFTKEHIDLPASITKTRERRLVPMRATLRAWIEPLAGDGLLLSGVRPDNMAKRIKRQFAGWKKNGLRHSYGSYRAAETSDLPRVSYEMGNTVDILKKRYHEAKYPAEAAEFFGLTPEKVGRSIVANSSKLGILRRA